MNEKNQVVCNDLNYDDLMEYIKVNNKSKFKIHHRLYSGFYLGLETLARIHFGGIQLIANII